MKFYLSLNQLRTLSEPKLQMQMFDQIGFFSIIDGMEINADFNDPLEVVRLNEYAMLLQQYRKHVQIHTPTGFSHHYKSFNYLAKGLKVYGQLAEKLRQNLIVVVHPVDDPCMENAKKKTCELIHRLNTLKLIHQYDLTFVLENLVQPRLGMNELSSLIEENSIPLCWDIGHTTMNGHHDYTLSSACVRQLKNVHIHDINHQDHHPFIYGKTDYMKAMHYLITINYTNSVVVEMKYEHLRGNNLYDKFEDYLYQVILLKHAHDTLTSIAL